MKYKEALRMNLLVRFKVLVLLFIICIFNYDLVYAEALDQRIGSVIFIDP